MGQGWGEPAAATALREGSGGGGGGVLSQRLGSRVWGWARAQARGIARCGPILVRMALASQRREGTTLGQGRSGHTERLGNSLAVSRA